MTKAKLSGNIKASVRFIQNNRETMQAVGTLDFLLNTATWLLALNQATKNPGPISTLFFDSIPKIWSIHIA